MGKIKPLIIGAAGGSGAGKTTVIKEILKKTRQLSPVFLQHDSYYKDNGRLSQAEKEKINYDHPDALETDLLVHHLEELSAGKEILVPQYDFTTHSRKAGGVIVKPASVILVDGILLFVEKALRELLDLRIFVEADDDIRFIRRLKRDIKERGRTVESVVQQYLDTVKPMYEAFVAPSRRHAHVIIPQGGHNPIFTRMVVDMIKQRLTVETH